MLRNTLNDRFGAIHLIQTITRPVWNVKVFHVISQTLISRNESMIAVRNEGVVPSSYVRLQLTRACLVFISERGPRGRSDDSAHRIVSRDKIATCWHVSKPCFWTVCDVIGTLQTLEEDGPTPKKCWQHLRQSQQVCLTQYGIHNSIK